MTQIGDTLWLFDENRRVYRKAVGDRLFGSIIWSEHFRPAEITGETRASWLLKSNEWREHKVSKTTLYESIPRFGRRQWFTDDGKADAIWKNDNEGRIRESLRGATIAQLKQIDAILNEAQ